MPDLDNVLHIPLNTFTYEDAQELYTSLTTLLQNNGRCVLCDDDRGAKRVRRNAYLKDSEAEFERILSQLWSHVVKPVLNGLAITVCCFQIDLLPYSYNIFFRIHPLIICLEYGGAQLAR